MVLDKPGKKLTRCLLLGLCLLLSHCGGNYRAPVSEQGERQIRSAPIIVNSSTPESSFRVPVNRAIRSSSPTSASVFSSASSSGNRVNSSARISSSAVTHRVLPGDSVFSIAFQYDLDFRELASANGLHPPYTIFVGGVLNLDLNNVPRAQSAYSNLGTAVATNSVARSQAGSARRGAVTRQPIASSQIQELRWQWPHQGRLLRGFQNGISKGLDISGARGDSVVAAGDGDVVYTGRGVQGSGDLIIIRHSDRYLSAYAHNSVMLVRQGSRVRAGEKIAEIGETPAGIAMLHFEIREDGNSVDPSRFLPRR